jgi:hypothetical protein
VISSSVITVTEIENRKHKKSVLTLHLELAKDYDAKFPKRKSTLNG